MNAHRIPGYAAMNSGSIRLVIELFERYVGLRSPLVSTSHEARGKEIQVDFDECPLSGVIGVS